MQTKYLERFAKLADGPHKLPMRGNRLLLELLPPPEIKTAGGLIVASSLTDHRSATKENAADVAVVLATGEGYYGDDGAPVPLDLQVGNVVLVSRFGMRTYSTFPGIKDYVADTIALARDSDMHARWESVEAFEAYVEALNS